MRDDRTGVVWAMVCLAALLMAGPTAAQGVDGGIKVGMVAGRLSLDGTGAFDTTARAGATGGGFVTVGIGRYWRLQLEALYAERRFRSSGLPIPAKTPPGEYTIGVGLYDSKARTLAKVTAGSGVGGDEVRLGTLRIR